MNQVEKRKIKKKKNRLDQTIEKQRCPKRGMGKKDIYLANSKNSIPT